MRNIISVVTRKIIAYQRKKPIPKASCIWVIVAQQWRAKTIVYYIEDKIFAKEVFDKNDHRKLFGKIPDGIVREYYDNGRIKEEWFYKDGKRNGRTRKYCETGKLLLEARYKNDKLNGPYHVYHENGLLCEEGFYKYYKGSEWNLFQDTKTGLYKQYYKNGKRREEGKCNGSGLFGTFGS